MNYYMKIKKEEHMLYATEIAKLYNIFSVSGKPYAVFIGLLIEDYIKNHNLYYVQLYYSTKSGLAKVYPRRIYHKAIKEKLYDNKDSLNNDINKIKIMNKNINFIWKYKNIEILF